MNAAPSSVADALGLRHQRTTDPALARAGVDDQRQHAQDPVVVLEAGHRVERDEAQQRLLVLRDQDARMVRREAAEALDDVARAGRVALVGEEGGDGLGIGLGGGPDGQGGVGHGGDGTASTKSRWGPASGPPSTRRSVAERARTPRGQPWAGFGRALRAPVAAQFPAAPPSPRRPGERGRQPALGVGLEQDDAQVRLGRRRAPPSSAPRG